MASRTVAPSGWGGGNVGVWALIGAFGLEVAASGALWVSGGAVSAWQITREGPPAGQGTAGQGEGWVSARWDLFLAVSTARGGTGASWPGADPVYVWAGAAGLLLTVLLPVALLVWRVARSARQPADPGASMARPGDLTHLTRLTQARRITRGELRPSLAGTKLKDLPPTATGWALGRLRPGTAVLQGSWEDVGVAFMAPRSGKTTAYAVPLTLDAPGPVIATSNKDDLWVATASIRAADTGARVWTFDPQGVAGGPGGVPQTWWWDPLRAVTTVEEAERLAGHFVLTVADTSKGDIWAPAAGELLAALFMAARESGGTVLDVYSWLQDEASPLPVSILRAAGHGMLAESLEGVRSSPDATRGSVYFTARVATKCLRNPQITAWVTPPTTDTPATDDCASRDSAGSNSAGSNSAGGGLTEFHAETFPTTRETLYLLSKDGGGSAAPLVAALTDRIMRDGAAAAGRQPGARLDPPLMAVLDEAANICRIGDLPSLYSHLGSRGIVPLTILQSYAQGVGVWGENGMKALWGAATVKLIGSGVDDASFAEDLSRLIGDADVDMVSVSTSDGKRSRSRSVQQRRILTAADIRALPKGRVLVLSTGAKAALLHAVPWYSGPRRQQITAALTAAGTQRNPASARTTAGAL